MSIINSHEDSIIIRKMNEMYIKDLFLFLNELDKKTQEFFHPHSFDLQTIQKILQSEKDYYYIMLLNEYIIGYAFFRFFSFEIPSFGIVIRKGYTGKGFGNYFIKWMIEKARKLGFKKVILKTYKQNIVAQKLYNKHGFKITGLSEDKKQYEMELLL